MRADPELQVPERVSNSSEDVVNDKAKKLHWQAHSLDNYASHRYHLSSQERELMNSNNNHILNANQPPRGLIIRAN